MSRAASDSAVAVGLGECKHCFELHPASAPCNVFESARSARFEVHSSPDHSPPRYADDQLDTSHLKLRDTIRQAEPGECFFNWQLLAGISKKGCRRSQCHYVHAPRDSLRVGSR